MRRPATASVLLVAVLTGCRESSPPPTSLVRVEIPAAEAGWRSQIDAVRDGRSDEIRVTEFLVSSNEFRELADGCDGLATLILDRADLATADLSFLPDLPNLRWIKLPTAVDDEAASVLSECRGLETLNVPAAVFTDVGLAELATLERLSLFRFASPDVTDAGLKPLAALPNLRFLHLLDVPITDAGLEHVAAIPSLESFYLDGGRVTDAGLQRLLDHRPDLHFHKDENHLPGDPNADDHG